MAKIGFISLGCAKNQVNCGLISNALHVGYHFKGGGNGPEVPGHRLLLEQQLQAQVLNGPLHFIDFAVVCYSSLRHCLIAFGGCIHRRGNGRFTQVPHGDQIGVQLFQLLVKAVAHHPNLPVM